MAGRQCCVVRGAWCVKTLATKYAIRTTLRLCVLLAGLAATQIIFPTVILAQEPIVPPSVTGGQALWPENCLPCHGPAGQGDGPTAEALPNPPANLADPELSRQLSPADNFDTIKNGRMENMMPPWGNRFDDAQIWDLTAHVWSFSTSPEMLAQGETVYPGAMCRMSRVGRYRQRF